MGLSKRILAPVGMSTETGEAQYTLLGFKGNPHTNPLHIASNVVIALGFWALAASWRLLYNAQRGKKLATTGLYARVRHPQYDGFVLIMFGFLLQWPTLVTLIMFLVLVVTYVRLARREEREVRAEFGPMWDAYAAETPAFIPRLRSRGPHPGSAADVHA